MSETDRRNAAARKKSPCVRNCCLDEQDVCLGCGRTLTEITQWTRFSAEEIESVLSSAQQRLQSRSATGTGDSTSNKA